MNAPDPKPIQTRRLDLHMVLPQEYERLAADAGDPRLWVDRGFANPYGHLRDDPGPLPHRLPLIEANPQSAPYLLRMAVHRVEAVIIGSAGFHGMPDGRGMIEIGVGIEPHWRGQGYATEVLHGMWGWVIDQPGVRVLRYTVSPGNAPSQAIIRRLGFAWRGQQMDPEDGPEDIFEMGADEYRHRFAAPMADRPHEGS